MRRVVRCPLREAIRRWRRAGQGLARVVYSVGMLALYATLLPFAIVVRLTKPALKIEELPAIDLILLSHAHFDHIDWRTLRRFDGRTQVVTAPRTQDLLGWTRLRRITELRWGERQEVRTVAGSLVVRAIPVNHWGARMRSDTYRGYNGYTIESKR